jgi:hypothetical protein
MIKPVKLSFALVCTLAVGALSAHAEDLMIDYVGGPNSQLVVGDTVPTPEPSKTPIPNYIGFGTGLGYRTKTGTVGSQGAFATFRARGYQRQGTGEYNPGPTLIGDGASNFNVFNKDQNANILSTEFAAHANMFVGYSFNKGQPGVDFIVGMGARGNASGSVYSIERGQVQGSIGPETGLHIDASDVVATLTGSVTVGGESCAIKSSPNGSPDTDLVFNTNAVGFAGIGRLLISDKFYMNVLYVNYPMVTASSAANVKQGAKLAQGTLFWNIGKKITLTGDCSIQTMNKETTVTNDSDHSTTIEVSKFNQNQFSIGVIRRFGH